MDLDPGTLEKSSVDRDGIPPSDHDPKKLDQSTDKSSILMEHECALVKHKERMNSDPDLIVQFGSGVHISINLESTPAVSGPFPSPSTPVHLIPPNRVDIATLIQNPDKVLIGKYFLCRTMAPSYRTDGINAIVEDPEGQHGIRISVYNYSSWNKCNYDDLLEELPVAQILAFKNPLFKSTQNGEFLLQCDNPEDVIFISEMKAQELLPWVKWEGQIPEKFQKFMKSTPRTPLEWKNQGNKEFLRQKFVQAVQSYTKGLNLMNGAGSDSATKVTCDIMSNRAAAYLKLDCFQMALDDVDKLLGIDPLHFKKLYRRAKALMGLQRFQEVVQFLELASNSSKLYSENKKSFLDLLKLAQHFLKQQKTGEYDILKLYKAGDVHHDDCADFVGPVKVQKISGGRTGRGLFATQNIQPGQLISATKAFEIIFPAQEQGPCPGVAIFVKPGTNVQFVNPNPPTHSQQNIVQKIVQKLTLEPNLCRTFYQLYAGPDFPIYEDENDPVEVDLKRIEAICRYNSFPSELTRKSDCPFPFALGKSTGIWILPSFINHRCWDVNALWTTFRNMLFVRALKVIPQGEEIFISYLDPSQLYEEREKILKVHGFMSCECQLCLIDRDNSKEGQKRMKLLKKIQENRNSCVCPQLHMEIEMLMKKIWDLDKGGRKPNLKLNPSLHYPLHDLALFHLSRRYKIAIDMLMKRHALTTNSALKQKAVESCFSLIIAHLKVGQIQQAKKWTEILKTEMKTLYGTLDMAKSMAGKETLDFMEQHNIFLP